MTELAGIPRDATPTKRVDMGPTEPQLPLSQTEASGSASKAVEEAIAAAQEASQTPTGGGAAGPTGGTAPGTHSGSRPEEPPAP